MRGRRAVLSLSLSPAATKECRDPRLTVESLWHRFLVSFPHSGWYFMRTPYVRVLVGQSVVAFSLVGALFLSFCFCRCLQPSSPRHFCSSSVRSTSRGVREASCTSGATTVSPSNSSDSSHDSRAVAFPFLKSPYAVVLPTHLQCKGVLVASLRS